MVNYKNRACAIITIMCFHYIIFPFIPVSARELLEAARLFFGTAGDGKLGNTVKKLMDSLREKYPEHSQEQVGQFHPLNNKCVFSYKIKLKIMVTVIRKGSDKEEVTQLEKALKTKGVDTYKYCGVIKLKEDPLTIQKRMRDEWE